MNRSLLQLCLSIGSLLIVFRSTGNLLQLCLSNLKSLASFSSSNQILHFNELSLEVQGGQDYFRFVERTFIIALCPSSLSLSLIYPLHLDSDYHFISWTLSASEQWLQYEKTKKKLTQFNPLFLCFSHLFLCLNTFMSSIVSFNRRFPNLLNDPKALSFW